MVKNKYEYDRVEVTFSKDQDLESEMFRFLEVKGKIVGKGKFLKQLLYEQMEREKGSK